MKNLIRPISYSELCNKAEGYDAQALQEKMEEEGWEKKGYAIITIKI